jgi:uncharacterized protein
MDTEFTPIASLAGGVMIGLAAVLLMVLNGRIAGMTKMLEAVLTPWVPDAPWRIAFLVGAFAAPLVASGFGAEFPFAVASDGWVPVAGGVLVGIGVTYGSGCTSGHGVCGIARLSRRSIIATVIFMATAFVTVALIRHGIGG